MWFWLEKQHPCIGACVQLPLVLSWCSSGVNQGAEWATETDLFIQRRKSIKQSLKSETVVGYQFICGR